MLLLLIFIFGFIIINNLYFLIIYLHKINKFYFNFFQLYKTYYYFKFKNLI